MVYILKDFRSESFYVGFAKNDVELDVVKTQVKSRSLTFCGTTEKIAYGPLNKELRKFLKPPGAGQQGWHTLNYESRKILASHGITC